VLAATTRAELDTGHFTRSVDTSAGVLEYTMALPALLAPPGQPPGPGRLLKVGPRATEGFMADLDHLLQGRNFQNAAEVQRYVDSLTRAGTVPKRPIRTDRERAQALCHEAFESPGRRRLQLARLALELDPLCSDALLLSAEWEDELVFGLAPLAMLSRALDLSGRHDEAAGVVAELLRLDPDDHLRVRNRQGILG